MLTIMILDINDVAIAPVEPAMQMLGQLGVPIKKWKNAVFFVM